MRALNAHSTWHSDWHPETRLLYIVRAITLGGSNEDAGFSQRGKMLEWLVLKIDELLAISMRVAVAMESIAVSLRHMHSPNGLQGEMNSFHDVLNRIAVCIALQ